MQRQSPGRWEQRTRSLVSYPSMGKQERPEKFPNSVRPSESHISWRLLYGCCTDNSNATANCLKPLVAPVEIEGGAKILCDSAYGIRLGLFAGVRTCSPRASFLASLFTANRSLLLIFVGVAVRVAVQPGSWYTPATPHSPATGSHGHHIDELRLRTS